MHRGARRKDTHYTLKTHESAQLNEKETGEKKTTNANKSVKAARCWEHKAEMDPASRGFAFQGRSSLASVAGLLRLKLFAPAQNAFGFWGIWIGMLSNAAVGPV